MKLKYLVLSLFLFFMAAPGFSQEWMLDYDSAIAQAKEQNKPVLVFFTGSDWCRPCMMIKENVYSTDLFKEFASENLILVLADFPKRPQNKLSAEQEQKNRELSQVFRPRGFPTSVLINTQGQELERWVGYDRSGAEGYIEKFKEAANL
jgi:thioredoxin-related protein